MSKGGFYLFTPFKLISFRFNIIRTLKIKSLRVLIEETDVLSRRKFQIKIGGTNFILHNAELVAWNKHKLNEC